MKTFNEQKCGKTLRIRIISATHRNIINSWYIGNYQLSFNTKMQSIKHYHEYGFRNNYNLNPLFNTKWSKMLYAKIKNIRAEEIDKFDSLQIEKFIEFFEHSENVSSSPVFKKDCFKQKYSELIDNQLSLELNFINNFYVVALEDVIDPSFFNLKKNHSHPLESINILSDAISNNRLLRVAFI